MTALSTVESSWERSLSVEEPTRVGTPLEFPVEPLVGPVRTGAIHVSARDMTWLRNADTLHLLFATYETSPLLKVARLRSADGSCEFATAQDVPLQNNAPLVFHKVRCDSDDPVMDMTLFVRLGDTGRAALWTFPAGDSRQDEPLIVSAPDGTWHQSLRGTMVMGDASVVVRRIDLIAYLWQTRTSRAITWFVVLTGLVLAGAVLMRGRLMPVGVAIVAFSAATAWAIVIPPLQGADEPDHLLSFAEVTGAAQVAPQLETLARRSHFERMRFFGDERFRPSDRLRPHPVAWTGDVHAERMDSRSPTAARMWRIAAALGIRNIELPDLLLLVRLFNALVFGAAMGVAAWVIAWAGVPGRAWSLVGLAIIPTLPFFAAMLSDWAFVVSWSVWCAASLILLLHDGPRAQWAGLGLGLSTALLASTSIAALGLGPLLVVVIVARLIMGGNVPVFWGGLAAGAVGGYVLTRDLFAAGFQRYDAASGASADLLSRVNQAVGLLAEAPWLVLVGIALLAGIDLALAPLRRSEVVARAGRLIATGVAFVVVGIIGLTLLLSLIVDLPRIGTLPDPRYTSVVDYMQAVVVAVLTAARVQGFDHLTFSSFWSGFGWIDSVVPSVALSVFALLMSAATVTTMMTWWRGGHYRQLGWMGCYLVGAFGSLAAYAAASYLMGRNIHGRYLMALAIPMVALLTTGAGAVLSMSAPSLRVLAIAVAAAIHGLSLAWVMLRYF